MYVSDLVLYISIILDEDQNQMYLLKFAAPTQLFIHGQ
jgi:hypothetical protein